MVKKYKVLTKETVLAAFAMAKVANEHFRAAYLMEQNLSKIIRGDYTYNGFVTDLLADNHGFELMAFLEAMAKENFISDAEEMYNDIIGSKEDES